MSYTSILTLTGPAGASSLPATVTIPVESISFGIENKTTLGSSSSGAGAGKATFDALTITRTVDTVSPLLFVLCANGGHYTKGVLTLIPQGSTAPIIIYTFGLIFCTAVLTAGNQHGGVLPIETDTFVFGQLDVQYKASASAPVVDGNWSIVNNTGTFSLS